MKYWIIGTCIFAAGWFAGILTALSVGALDFKKDEWRREQIRKEKW